MTKIEAFIPDTDIARDPDDFAALLAAIALHKRGKPRLAGVTTTHVVPSRRAYHVEAILEELDVSDVEVGAGATYPLAREGDTEYLSEYLKAHTLTVEGSDPNHPVSLFYDGSRVSRNLPRDFYAGPDKRTEVVNAQALLESNIRRYGRRLAIGAMAPMMNLARIDPDLSRSIGVLYVQGQAVVENGKLLPNARAYNIGTDFKAAAKVLKTLEGHVPIVFVGSHALHEIRFSRKRFDDFAALHPVGEDLRWYAHMAIRCFFQRNPDAMRAIYGADAHPDTMTHLSKLYDPTLIAAMARPELFNFHEEVIGGVQYLFIGQVAGRHREDVPDPSAVEEYIASLVTEALRPEPRYVPIQ